MSTDHHRRHDRLALSLDVEGGKGFGLEAALDARQKGVGRHHLSVLGPAHDPSGQVDGVTGEGIDPAIGGAGVVDEETSVIEARPHTDRAGRRMHNIEGGTQQPVLVVAAHHGETSGEQDLSSVSGDIDVVERHAVAIGGCLSPRDDGLKRLSDSLAPRSGRQGVDTRGTG